MPLFDSIAVLVTAGAVTVSATSLIAVLRGPQKHYEKPRMTDAEIRAARNARSSVNADIAPSTASAKPAFLERCKPVLTKAWRLCYRSTITFLPALSAVGAAWLLMHSPETFTRALPAMFSDYGARIADVVPLHPNNVLEAFDLGAAWRALQSGQTDAALALAASVAGRPVSLDELSASRGLVAELAAHRGLAERVWSSFTIVNCVWAIAACGVVGLVVPFTVIVLRPIVIRIPWEKIAKAAKTVAIRCLPLAEPALFATAVGLAVEGARYAGTDTMAGTMLSFTGALVFNAGVFRSFAVAVMRWGRSNNARGAMVAWGLLSAAYAAPLAILHQSTFLGYVTMGSIAGALGLFADAYPWGIFIGFQSRRDLMSTAIGLGSLTWGYLLMSAAQVQPAALAPFQSAVGVLGTTGYLLALDIQALINGNVASYVLYGTNVGIYFVAGELLGLQGLSNVAKTFAGIGLFTLFCGHFPHHSNDARTVYLFLLFSALYGGCMFLNRNPQLITSLFGGNPFLKPSEIDAPARVVASL